MREQGPRWSVGVVRTLLPGEQDHGAIGYVCGQCSPVVSWSHKEFEHRSQDEGARQKETDWRYKPKGIRLRGKKWVLSLATDKTELWWRSLEEAGSKDLLRLVGWREGPLRECCHLAGMWGTRKNVEPAWTGRAWVCVGWGAGLRQEKGDLFLRGERRMLRGRARSLRGQLLLA